MWLRAQLFDLAYSIICSGTRAPRSPTVRRSGRSGQPRWRRSKRKRRRCSRNTLSCCRASRIWIRRAEGRTAAAAAAPPAQGKRSTARTVDVCRSCHRRLEGEARGSTEPYVNAVFEAAQYVDASNPSYTHLSCISPARRATCPYSRRATTRRRAQSCLADFRQCSRRVIRDSSRVRSFRARRANLQRYARPCRARHREPRMGLALRAPARCHASDFGTQGDKPTHPELLDDLAARFIEHGWSLKWLSKRS